jgi:cytochrome oxidase Cu insertion factor (SCO1/SenC/PrrC family)
MMMRILACAVFAFGVFSGSQQAPPRPAAELDKLGPQVGSGVPDFSLIDQNGRTHTLKSVLGPSGAMLVFFRSADW